MFAENKTTEFKREYVEDIKNTIVAFGVSQSTAILLMRELTDEGVLIKKGKTKNLRYYENK